LESIIDLLVKIQILDERQHDAVMSRSRSPAGGHVVQQVADMGYATEATVARAVSVELGLPRIDLAMTPPEGAALALLDARTCADKFVLPSPCARTASCSGWRWPTPPTRIRSDSSGASAEARAARGRRPDRDPPRGAGALCGPGAGSTQPEPVQNDKLAAIEIEGNGEEAFEVLNVADDIGKAPSRGSRRSWASRSLRPSPPRSARAAPPRGRSGSSSSSRRPPSRVRSRRTIWPRATSRPWKRCGRRWKRARWCCERSRSCAWTRTCSRAKR